MSITVILCTFNRCESLTVALDSVAASKLPSSVKWEVLVVDNNSTDKTRDVVDEYCRRHPGRFRYLFESQPGKSHALNAGIREAQGDVLAFMDDDVTVEPDWLQHLTAALHNDEYAGSGGRVVPGWKSSPPRWLWVEERGALAPLVAFDLGPDAGPLTEAPFGTNMAFRKAIFLKYGGFRTDLGPRPNSEIRNEDTEFGKRVLRAGERMRYEPSAVVCHPVPENRLTKRYFQAWWFDKARADIRELGIPSDTKWFICGVPLHMFRRIVVGTLRWIIAPKPSRRFSQKLKVWGIAGAILEFHRQSREARNKLPMQHPASVSQSVKGSNESSLG